MRLTIDRSADVPLGTQLVWQVRALVADGSISPGDRLPSVRELAEQVGVNVNTVRAAYRRLEEQGVARSEHGRGTFVARDAAARGELRREIAALEAELVRHPDLGRREPSGQAPGLLTTAELAGVRDELLDRLRRIDADRMEVLQRLEELRLRGEPSPTARSSSTLSSARIRWLPG